MSSGFVETPGAQVRRLQGENRRLQAEVSRLRRLQPLLGQTDQEGLKESADDSGGNINLRPQYRRNSLDTQFGKSNQRWDDEADVLKISPSLNTDAYFKPPSPLAYHPPTDKKDKPYYSAKIVKPRHEEDEDAAAILARLEFENALLRSEIEEAILSREDLGDALQCALAQCDSLQQQLDRKHPGSLLDPDEKFAQLVEARIERDKAVHELDKSNALNERIKAELKEMEDHNKALQQKLKTMEADLVEDKLSHKKAVGVLCRGALLMMNRARELAEGGGDARMTSIMVELPDEEWARVLMRPLEDEMEKIESSFNKKRVSTLGSLPFT